MNLTNKDFEAIKKALELLPTREEFNKLSKKHQDIIVNADTVMVNLLKKKRTNNERTSKYIAEKRKENKNYARSKN